MERGYPCYVCDADGRVFTVDLREDQTDLIDVTPACPMCEGVVFVREARLLDKKEYEEIMQENVELREKVEELENK